MRGFIGPLQTYTGDTLVQSASAAEAALERRENGSAEGGVLAGVGAPPPVFFCTIEPDSAARQEG